jgi:hypothetical protein
LDALERQLREVLERHRTRVLSLAVDEGTSRAAFRAQLLEAVSEAESESKRERAGQSSRPFAKLAAIDVAFGSIQEVLRATSEDSRFESFWQTVGASRDGSGTTGSWTKKPHVTMVHFSQADQDDIHSSFGPLEGWGVKVRATSLVWNDRVAALGVEVDGHAVPPDMESLDAGTDKATTTTTTAKTAGAGSVMVTATVRDVPRPRNEFAHVTVWSREDAAAVESNDLPRLVGAGRAERVELRPPADLAGAVRLWTR